MEAQAVQGVDQSLTRRALAACAIGNATEWFDYSTYGFLAIIRSVLPTLFVPPGCVVWGTPRGPRMVF
jgi:hypothetical protein